MLQVGCERSTQKGCNGQRSVQVRHQSRNLSSHHREQSCNSQESGPVSQIHLNITKQMMTEITSIINKSYFAHAQVKQILPFKYNVFVHMHNNITM